jgi:hypothetical protein
MNPELTTPEQKADNQNNIIESISRIATLYKERMANNYAVKDERFGQDEMIIMDLAICSNLANPADTN